MAEVEQITDLAAWEHLHFTAWQSNKHGISRKPTKKVPRIFDSLSEGDRQLHGQHIRDWMEAETQSENALAAANGLPEDVPSDQTVTDFTKLHNAAINACRDKLDRIQGLCDVRQRSIEDASNEDSDFLESLAYLDAQRQEAERRRHQVRDTRDRIVARQQEQEPQKSNEQEELEGVNGNAKQLPTNAVSQGTASKTKAPAKTQTEKGGPSRTKQRAIQRMKDRENAARNPGADDDDEEEEDDDDDDSGDDEDATRIRRGRLNSRWSYVCNIGSGSYGSADLWAKQNQYGMIVDRMTLKDCNISPDASGILVQPDGRPTEVAAMYQLKACKGSDTIVSIRNWRSDIKKRQSKYRIYMEFCPYGDLYGAFIRPTSHYGKHNFLLAEESQKARLPEPFTWSVFESLAIAGMLMQWGNLDMDAQNDWKEIVHRDIRAANIFVTNNSKERYGGYPAVKVGDFGLALVLAANDQRTGGEGNPFFLTSEGFIFNAPEIVCDHLQGDEENNPQKPRAKTNVWQVGYLMWSLLQLENGYAGLNGWDWQTPKYPTWDPEIKDRYSGELTKLIDDCLQYLPKDRPSFDRILKRIRQHTGGRKVDLARGLRHAPADDKGFRKRHAVLLGRERLALGSFLREEYRAAGGLGSPPAPLGGTEHYGNDSSDSTSDDDFGGATGQPMKFPKPVVVPATGENGGQASQDDSGGSTAQPSTQQEEEQSAQQQEDGVDQTTLTQSNGSSQESLPRVDYVLSPGGTFRLATVQNGTYVMAPQEGPTAPSTFGFMTAPPTGYPFAFGPGGDDPAQTPLDGGTQQPEAQEPTLDDGEPPVSQAPETDAADNSRKRKEPPPSEAAYDNSKRRRS